MVYADNSHFAIPGINAFPVRRCHIFLAIGATRILIGYSTLKDIDHATYYFADKFIKFEI
jgi:hypothetical protein